MHLLQQTSLDLIAVFVEVAEQGSFTQAAHALGMQRSAVSRRVAQLESELGVNLLHRTTRKVAPTSAGRRLLRDSAPLLRSLADVVRGVPQLAREPAGDLRITAPADLAQWCLPTVLGALTRAHPRLRPVIHASNRVVDLEEEGFDVALRAVASTLTDSSLRARRLGTIPTRLCGAPAYLERHGAPVAGEPPDGHVIVHIDRTVVPPELEPASFVVVDDVRIAAELVRQGVGIGLLPSYLVVDDLASGALVPLLPGVCFGWVELYAVFPSSRGVPLKVQVFRDALLAFLEENPLDPEGFTTARAG